MTFDKFSLTFNYTITEKHKVSVEIENLYWQHYQTMIKDNKENKWGWNVGNETVCQLGKIIEQHFILWSVWSFSKC